MADVAEQQSQPQLNQLDYADQNIPGTSLDCSPAQYDQPLSKNAQKRLKRKEIWESRRDDRKILRKRKLHDKRERDKEIKRQKYMDEHSVNNLGEGDAASPNVGTNQQAPKQEHARHTTTNIRCIIDCAFDDLMIEKEIFSLGAQLTRCYADNKKAIRRMNLEFTSVDKRLLERFNLMHGKTWKNWKKILITEEPYKFDEVQREAGNVVYLTADADETLEELEEGKTYIVGGIIDKNRHKGLCYNKAISQNLRTAKLPIGEFIKMNARLVLTTNQVIEIMLEWLYCKNWEHAFLKVIPMRKQAAARGDGTKEEEENVPSVDGEGEGEYKDRERATKHEANLSNDNDGEIESSREDLEGDIP